jgi:hypothetical protein
LHTDAHAETYKETEVTLCLMFLDHKFSYNKYICNLINCQPDANAREGSDMDFIYELLATHGGLDQSATD